MEPITLVIGIAAVIFSIILHEVAHGYMAELLGDHTAKYAGRLTLNPIPHIDPFGSILLPGLMAFTGGPMIGWAKPVPFNPYNLSNQKWGEALVAFAGPATNIVIAVCFGLVIRFFGNTLNPVLLNVLVMTVFSNLSLAALNLIPIPPLDGSKVLKSLLPTQLAIAYASLERMAYSFGSVGLIVVLLIFVNLLSGPVSKFVYFLFSLIVGA